MTMLVLLLIFTAAFLQIGAEDHERFVRATWTRVSCKKHLETCLTDMCQRTEHMAKCNNDREAVRSALKNCIEPYPEACVNSLPNPPATVLSTTWSRVACKKNLEECLNAMCLNPRHSGKCNYNREAVRAALQNCIEPTADACVEALAIPSTTIFVTERVSLTRDGCRNNPYACLNEFCRRPLYSAHCASANTYNIMVERLRTCNEYNPEDCLRNLPSTLLTWTNPFSWVAAANPLSWNAPAVTTRTTNHLLCGAQINYCLQLACVKLEKYPGFYKNCNTPGIRDRLSSHLQSCKVYELDICTQRFIDNERSGSWVPSISVGSSVFANPIQQYASRDFSTCSIDNLDSCAPGLGHYRPDIANYCRTNTEKCLPIACRLFESLFGMKCSDANVKNTLREKLRSCYASFGKCISLLSMPLGYQWNHADCNAKLPNCMAYACQLQKQGLTYGCEDWYVKAEVENRLKTCHDYKTCYNEKILPLKPCTSWCPIGYECRLSRCFPKRRSDPTYCYNRSQCVHDVYNCVGNQCVL